MSVNISRNFHGGLRTKKICRRERFSGDMIESCV